MSAAKTIKDGNALLPLEDDGLRLLGPIVGQEDDGRHRPRIRRGWREARCRPSWRSD